MFYLYEEDGNIGTFVDLSGCLGFVVVGCCEKICNCSHSSLNTIDNHSWLPILAVTVITQKFPFNQIQKNTGNPNSMGRA